MKKCPQCQLEYFDNMLEFCLEDGVRLIDYNRPKTTAAVPEKQKDVFLQTETAAPHGPQKTVLFESAQTSRPAKMENEQVTMQTVITERTGKTTQILEIAPIVISLAHNWWQWLYLEDQYYTSFTTYVFSANFLMWLLLLAAGTTVSLFSLRSARNKGFTYASLVILAVNLLLFVVPRR